VSEINQLAEVILPALIEALGENTSVEITDTFSQIGSGSLPLDLLPSKSISISSTASSQSDRHLQKIAGMFRALPVPVIGRINDGKLLFDLRTLDSPDQLIGQLSHLGKA
jgi:L-seryl-tRNA(Ser) seleniumtransferase